MAAPDRLRNGGRPERRDGEVLGAAVSASMIVGEAGEWMSALRAASGRPEGGGLDRQYIVFVSGGSKFVAGIRATRPSPREPVGARSK
jgi:hypothetical protein